MGYSPIRRVIGIVGDRVRVNHTHNQELPTQELALFVNSNGALMALTPEQVQQHISLGLNPDTPTPNDTPNPAYQNSDN